MMTSRLIKQAAACLLGLMIAATSVNAQDEAAYMNLIPTPKAVQRGDGTFRIQPGMRIFLPPGVERPEYLAATQLASLIEAETGLPVQLDRVGIKESPTQGIFLQIAAATVEEPGTRDAYTLSIDANAVRIEGASSHGLFYGIQTLKQLVRDYGSEIPGIEIQDAPDFQWRGFYHDVSRGKIPTLETLYELVDYLAERKINMLQLYIEHPFMFRFDPDIAHTLDGLTSEEILALQEYCKDRRIEFVPSLQSFGHMAGVLSLDRYRHFADVEMEGRWEELPWNPRMRGATIDVSNPEALALLEKMHDHYIPLFDSPFVNVCADETYDLGEGKAKALAEERGKGRLYLDHIEYLNNLAHQYGKRMMFWGDIVKRHEDLVGEIPKDAILLNWGYSRNTDFESSKLFADAGLDFFVCPGTSGWNRFINGIDNADTNIRRYAETGKKYGAIGLLNTDWGDHGHYNALGGSLHGISLGASMSWNVDTPTSPTFDRIWSIQTFNDPECRGVNAWRKLTTESDFYTWTTFYPPFYAERPRHRRDVTEEEAHTLIRNGQEAARVFEDYLRNNNGDPRTVREFLHASRMHVMLGEKSLILLGLREANSMNDEQRQQLADSLRNFADQLSHYADQYEEIWLARNKPSELHLITEKFKALEDEARMLEPLVLAGTVPPFPEPNQN